jgi:superfamily II DNA/RNA helicase
VKFSELGLNPVLLSNIEKLGFEHTSEVQDLTFAAIRKGEDVFAKAETGSGKTGSFAIPLIDRILSSASQEQELHLVLSPTRELAQQTHKFYNLLCGSTNITPVCVIGGEDIDKQIDQIQSSSNIVVVVGTPGRICDLSKRKEISIKNTKSVVFDEADRLFDMGFKKEIEDILLKTPKNRQLVMVSATTNQEVLRTAYRFHSAPTEIIVNEDSLLVDHIDHKLAMVSEDEKFPYLVNILRAQVESYAIVFCNTQFQTHMVAEWLKLMGFKAMPISGKLAQNKRTKLMEDFRSKKVTVLVCTDVASRGLDIKNVELVINYELPIEAANYVHRIGRTGRAGEEGKAISLCGHGDWENLEAIKELIQAKIEKMDITDEDFAKDLVKRPFIDRKTLKVEERIKREDRPNSKKVETRSERTPRKEKSKEAHVQSVSAPRFFEFTTSSYNEVLNKGIEFFNIDDKSLIRTEILKQGRRKFLLFGPRSTTYKVTLKPIFKKLLLPFLIKILRTSNLELFAKVSYIEPKVIVSFSGKDEGLLHRNRGELINAFDYLIRKYLTKKIELPEGTKIFVRAIKTKSKEDQEKYVIGLAEKAKAVAIEKGESIQLKPLSPSDRRIIHHHFQEDAKVQTSSVGEGRFKKIEISLR